ncbi:MAG: hypothetical protein K0Q79_3373 [Flavipsychrobacter sp.]|jgi:hypothetical protein|nr:hypothetical protein [Flavipsychrobacter sp.]
MEQKKQTHIQYGLITGMIMAVISIAIYLAGWSFKPGMSWLPYLPFLVGILMNAMAYSKANDGYVTFGNVYGSCIKMSMIVALIMVAWALICVFVFPEMKDKAMEYARAEMAKDPKMTEEIMDTALSMTQKFWNPIIIATAIFGTMFWGAILSLIGAAVAKKNGEKPMTAGDNF